jgi:hypothetical protein
MTGKTETIKQRRVDVYAPTEESKARWQAAAKDKNIPLSRYAGQILEIYLGEESADLQRDIQDLRRHVVDIESENSDLVKKLEDSELLRGRLERDIELYRAQELLSAAPIKKLDPRVVSAFSEARGHDGRLRAVASSELYKKLRIGRDEIERLNAVNLQLEAMELHEMILPSGKGWVWND